MWGAAAPFHESDQALKVIQANLTELLYKLIALCFMGPADVGKLSELCYVTGCPLNSLRLQLYSWHV